MRTITFAVISATAILSAGSLLSGRAEATLLSAAAANTRLGAEAINPVTNTATRMQSGIHARAQVRGPGFRPPGWNHGRKTGWNCRVGTRGCIPPGLR